MTKYREKNITVKKLILLAFLTILWNAFFINDVFCAPKINVDVSPRAITASGEAQIEISITNENEDGEDSKPVKQLSKPYCEPNPKFSLSFQGMESQRIASNYGKNQSSIVFRLGLAPRTALKPGDYEIEGCKIKIDGEVKDVGPIKISIGQSAPEELKFAQMTAELKPYQGEQVLYFADLIEDENFEGVDIEDLKAPGFLRLPLGKYSEESKFYGSKSVHRFKEILIPTTPGNLTLGERKVVAKFSRMQSFSFFKEVYQKEFVAPEVNLEVKPLPEPRPTNDYIPTGEITLESGLTPAQIKVGESVNAKITLVSKGDLRPLNIEERDLSGIRQLVEKSTQTVSETPKGVIFTKIFDVVITGERGGEYELPEIVFHYFNPTTKTYESVSTNSIKYTVTGNGGEVIQNVQIKPTVGTAKLNSSALDKLLVPDFLFLVLIATVLQFVLTRYLAKHKSLTSKSVEIAQWKSFLKEPSYSKLLLLPQNEARDRVAKIIEASEFGGIELSNYEEMVQVEVVRLKNENTNFKLLSALIFLRRVLFFALILFVFYEGFQQYNSLYQKIDQLEQQYQELDQSKALFSENFGSEMVSYSDNFFAATRALKISKSILLITVLLFLVCSLILGISTNGYPLIFSIGILSGIYLYNNQPSYSISKTLGYITPDLESDVLVKGEMGEIGIFEEAKEGWVKLKLKNNREAWFRV